MTAQSRDDLKINDETWRISQNPLEALIEQGKVSANFTPRTSANWRGYVASWEVRDDKLWLVGLKGTVKPKGGSYSDIRSTDLIEVMGGAGPFFADWFTGELLCSSGSLVNYIHAGYASRYENEVKLQVTQGHVTTFDEDTV